GTGSTSSANSERVTVPANLIKEVTSVPASVLDTVVIGKEPASKTSSASNPVAPVRKANTAPATVPPVSSGSGGSSAGATGSSGSAGSHGLPVFFYYGGEC